MGRENILTAGQAKKVLPERNRKPVAKPRAEFADVAAADALIFRRATEGVDSLARGLERSDPIARGAI